MTHTFLLKPPKTLDVNDFSLSIIRGLSFENSVTTLSELTCRSYSKFLFKLFKAKTKKIILVGGGRKNTYIYE